MRTTKQALVLLAVGLASASARGQTGSLHNVSDAYPYGEAPSGTVPFDGRLEAAIDASNPYAFNCACAALAERALPRVAVLRPLDFENPYGAGLAAVEHAPIDSENPYITGTR